MRSILFLAALLAATVARGQIIAPASVEEHMPIVCRSDGDAVSQTIGDDEALPLPAAAAGAAYIIPKLSSGTANLTFHFEQGS